MAARMDAEIVVIPPAPAAAQHKRMQDKDRLNMKRPISFEDQKWFDEHHDRKKSTVGTSLVNHGVVCYYENRGIENSRFFGDYVLVLEDNTLIDCTTSDLEQETSWGL